MSGHGEVVIVGRDGPVSTAVRKTLNLLRPWPIVRVDEVAQGPRVARGIMVIPDRVVETWNVLWVLIGRSYRGRILVFGHHPDLASLEHEGIFSLARGAEVGTMLNILDQGDVQVPVRPNARERAGVNSVSILKEIAGGNHHLVPNLGLDTSDVSGADQARTRRTIEIAIDRCAAFRDTAPDAYSKILAVFNQVIPAGTIGNLAPRTDADRITLEKAWTAAWQDFAARAAQA